MLRKESAATYGHTHTHTHTAVPQIQVKRLLRSAACTGSNTENNGLYVMLSIGRIQFEALSHCALLVCTTIALSLLISFRQVQQFVFVSLRAHVGIIPGRLRTQRGARELERVTWGGVRRSSHFVATCCRAYICIGGYTAVESTIEKTQYVQDLSPICCFSRKSGPHFLMAIVLACGPPCVHHFFCPGPGAVVFAPSSPRTSGADVARRGR